MKIVGSDKRSKEASALSYKDDLLNTLASMFVYKGFENEKKFNSEFIEIYLLIFGECAIWRNEGDLIVTYCNRCGKPSSLNGRHYWYNGHLVCKTCLIEKLLEDKVIYNNDDDL